MTIRMRVMLLGGDNALGKALLRRAKERKIHFIAAGPGVLNSSREQLAGQVIEAAPDVLVNLSHYFQWFQSKVADGRNLRHQEQENVWLANLCGNQQVSLFQLSSYRIFSGARATAYDEDDYPIPLSVLGESLYRLEQSIRTCCPKHIILRLGWLFDDSLEGRLADFMNQASQSVDIQLADDRRGNPTLVDDAARVIVAMLEQLDCNASLWGTYHYGGQEAVSALTFGQALLEEVREPKATLNATPHNQCIDVSMEPQYGVLSCKKILNTFGIKPRAWRAGLSELVTRYYRERD